MLGVLFMCLLSWALHIIIGIPRPFMKGGWVFENGRGWWNRGLKKGVSLIFIGGGLCQLYHRAMGKRMEIDSLILVLRCFNGRMGNMRCIRSESNFSYNKENQNETKFFESITKIRNVLKVWQMRHLRLEGKIIVFKTSAISKIVLLSLISKVPNKNWVGKNTKIFSVAF